MDTYNSIKQRFSKENYISDRIVSTKIRISNRRLGTETGRFYKILRNEILSRFCKNETISDIEDEKHVLLDALNEPTHEIMVLFVLRKLILQTRRRSHPVGLDV